MATHFRCLNLLIAPLAIMACPPSTYAAASADDPYFAPLPVVLTVSRLPRPPAEVPAAVTVIDAEMIRATGYRDLDRLMRLVPGMMVAKERSSEQWVSYHGPNADFPQQLLILIDGRSLSATYLGGFQRGALPITIDDIERIEIVRGTDAATYGSNAYLGVVNIITRQSADPEGRLVSVRSGTHGITDVSARIESSMGPVGLRLAAEHAQDQGMAGLHDDHRVDRLSLRGDLRLNERNELTLMSGLSESLRQTGYIGTTFNANRERDILGLEGYAHLKWRHAASADEEFTLSTYYSRDRVRNEWLANALGLVVPVDDNYISRRQNIDFTHHLRLNAAIRLSWGGEWRRDELEAPFLFFNDPVQTQDIGSLYGHVEWRPGSAWLFNAGAMVQRFERDFTRVSPRLFVNWLPEAGHTLRIGVSRAHRHPGVFEQHSDVRIFAQGTPLLLQQRWLPNPDIRPGELNAAEIGYRGEWSTWQSVLDLRLFQERIKDQIRRVTVVNTITNPLLGNLLPASSWKNLDETVRIEGIETQLDMQPWRGGTLLFRHTLMRVDANDKATRHSVSPYTASLSWLQRSGPWQSMLSLLRVGPLDAGTGFNPTYRYRVPAYTTLDASIAREIRAANGVPLELRLSGENLLGRHQELAHYPEQRTLGDKPLNKLEPQIYLSLSARF